MRLMVHAIFEYKAHWIDKCSTNYVVYQPTVNNNNGSDYDLHRIDRAMVERKIFKNHKVSFRYKQYANNSILSKYIWDIEKNGR